MSNGQGFLQQVFEGILNYAHQHLAEHRFNRERLALMREAIEQAVDACEPRIRLVGNYAEKLLDAVEIALRHSEDLLRRLPPALLLSSRNWAVDPRVNAFFATATDLRMVVSTDPLVRAFFSKNDFQECFVFMLMVKRETASYGMALQGDLLVREVPQTLVSFSSHHLFFPAASEVLMSKELLSRTLIFLATRALERINQLRTQRSDLTEQRRQLQAELRALRCHSQGLQPLMMSNDTENGRQPALKQRLLQIEEDLANTRKQLGTLDDYLEQLRLVLSQPEAFLQIRPLSLKLNRLGVKVEPDSSEPGETLRLFEITSLDQQRIGTLVRFARNELLAESELVF